jgi:hypothetical protein
MMLSGKTILGKNVLRKRCGNPFQNESCLAVSFSLLVDRRASSEISLEK